MAKITINGEQHTIQGDVINFEGIAEITGVDEPTVTFRKGADLFAEGTCEPGGHIHVKDGTVINAVNTGNA